MKSYGKILGKIPGSFATAWLVLLMALMTAPGLRADDYPSRPVNIIIPFTAGGPADTAARTFSEVLSRHLGQPLIAENRPAASGISTITLM